MGHFYFVRHGQTVWNVENKICGCTDSPLTEYGREQARETGRKILAIIFSMISGKNRKKKLTFWLPITESPELCSLILPI